MSHKDLRPLRIVLVIIPVVLFARILNAASDKISTRVETIRKVSSGHELYGYTPDWKNYILMSEYAAKLAPDSVMIASRKASISFMYGKRKFVGITKLPYRSSFDIAEESAKHIVINWKQIAKVRDPGLRNYARHHVQAWAFGVPKNGVKAISKSDTYAIISLDESKKSRSLLEALEQRNVFVTELEDFSSDLKKMTIVSPDELIQKLQKSKVEYVIMASLRLNPKQKTDRTIDTVKRYLYFIQLKYPYVLQKVHTIGTSEGANLYKINYSNARV